MAVIANNRVSSRRRSGRRSSRGRIAMIANDRATATTRSTLPTALDPDVAIATPIPAALHPVHVRALALPSPVLPDPFAAVAIPSTLDEDEAGACLDDDGA